MKVKENKSNNIVINAKKVKRNSNLELLRIICMIFIIADHFLTQSRIIYNQPLFPKIIFSFMMYLSCVGSTVFVIISSWFLVDSHFKINRIFKTWITIFTYSSIFLFISYKLGLYGSFKEIFYLIFFPVQKSNLLLWFPSYYIILLLFSPVLNKIINEMSKKTLRYILVIFILFGTLNSTFAINSGFFTGHMWVLIFIYLLTGYFKRYSFNFDKKKCLLVFFSMWIILSTLWAVSIHYREIYVLNVLYECVEFYRSNMDSIPNLVLSFSLFYIFYNTKIKNNKIINTIASTTLGIYCIHQVPRWYDFLWKEIFKSQYALENFNIFSIIVYSILVILAVLISTSIIELIRKKLFTYLIESRCWYKSICNKIDKEVEGLNDDNCDKENIIKKMIIIFSICFFLTFIIIKFLL